MGELGVGVDQPPDDPKLLKEVLVMPDGSRATRETMEQFEIAKVHLEAHDFAMAEHLFAELAITPARNNRLVALFHLSRVEEALKQALDAWDQDPGNLFALGWARAVAALSGRRDRGSGIGGPPGLGGGASPG